MRVLLITPNFPSPRDPAIGKGKYYLVKNMMNEGHDVTVVTLGNDKESSQNETLNNLKIYRVPSMTVPQIEYLIPNPFALVQLIKKIGAGFDIHHYYQQEYLTIIPSFLFESSVKVLTVDNFPGLDWYYGNRIIDMIARLESMTIGLRALRNFDGMIFLSTTSMKIARSLESTTASKRVTWIPHGVDTQRITPDEKVREKVRSDLRVQGIAIAFVGRLAPVKGVSYLAGAIQKLDNEGFNGHFIIVGDGPEKNKLETLKLSSSKIHLLGYRKNPVKYIQAADVLVLPSLGEGCPNVVLEAFACGKPVIASKVGAVPDLVQHKKNGLLINPRDVAGLVSAICSLTRDMKLVSLMGKEARKFAVTRLDWRVITKQILKFYSEFLD